MVETKIIMLKGEKGDAGGSTWGNISGSISNQTDLNSALNSKASTSSLGAAAFSNNYSDLSNIPNLKTVATTGSYTDLTNKPNLATVATSGSFNDLSNRPTQLSDLSGILSIEKGGTGATTETGIRTALGTMKRRLLCDVSSTGVYYDFQLNDDIKNYEILEICYHRITTEPKIEYYKITGENPVKPVLFCLLYDDSSRPGKTLFDVFMQNVTVSGTTFSFDSPRTVAFSIGNSSDYTDVTARTADLRLGVRFVAGYKY